MSVNGEGGGLLSATKIVFFKDKKMQNVLKRKHMYFDEIYSFGPVCVIKINVNYNHLQRKTTLGLSKEFRFLFKISAVNNFRDSIYMDRLFIKHCLSQCVGLSLCIKVFRVLI